MHELLPLHLLPIGSLGLIKTLNAEGTIRRRLLDLGLICGTIVESIKRSPAGDPIAYQIRGAVIALRSEEASRIIVETINPS